MRGCHGSGDDGGGGVAGALSGGVEAFDGVPAGGVASDSGRALAESVRAEAIPRRNVNRRIERDTPPSSKIPNRVVELREAPNLR